MITAGVLCVVGILNFAVIRNYPQDIGLLPLEKKLSSKEKKVRGDQWLGLSLQQAKTKPYFYACCFAVFLTGMVLQSIYGTAAAHMKDQGINADVIATVLSITSLLLMGTKAGVGILFDKLGLRLTMLICTTCAVITIFALAFVSGPVSAFIFCVCCAFALPLETIMLPLIARDLFGGLAYSKIMGLFVSINTFGYAVGVPLMNSFFDITGTYRPAMIAMGILMAVSAITMQLVISASQKDKLTYKQATKEGEQI